MRVTIGLPVFNAADHVRAAINSIIAQTVGNWNCIIIDDGSTDGSVEIIRGMIDDRFTLISDGENLGLARRLNQISQLSNGEYIARMDSDDVMHPERLEKQVRFLDGNRAIDVVGSSAYLIDVDNQIYGVRDVGNDFSFARLLRGSPFVHPSIMGRREWFVSNPYNPNANRVEDYELWLNSSKTSRFFNLDEPLLYYREAGLPYLKKYMLTSSGMRQVVSQYRAKAPVSFKPYGYYLTSLGKQGIFMLLHYLGGGEALMRARARRLDALEYLDACVNFNRATKGG